MTTPVLTRRAQSEGEKMEMTTPVITSKVGFILQGPTLHMLYYTTYCVLLYSNVIRYWNSVPFLCNLSTSSQNFL